MIQIPLTDVYLGIMAFARVGALMFMVPVLAARMVPIQFRTALAAMIAVFMLPALYEYFEVPTTLVGLGLAMIGEILVGILMGLAVRTVFFAAEFAADIMAQQSALMRSSSFDPTTEQQATTLGPLYFYLTALILFISDTHLEVLATFVRSYDYVPAGAGLTAINGVEVMARAFNNIFILGMKIAAPLLAMGFIINVIFAILGRVAPKVNVLILSFAARILIGLFMMYLTVELASEYLLGEALDTTRRMLEFLLS